MLILFFVTNSKKVFRKLLRVKHRVNTNKFSKFGGRVDINWSGTPYTVGHAVEMRITNDGLLGFDAEL